MRARHVRRVGSPRRLRITATALACLGLALASVPFATSAVERESEVALDVAAPAPAAFAPANRSHERGAGPALPDRSHAAAGDTPAQASHDLVLRHAVASPPARPALARWTLSHGTTSSLS